MGMGALCNLDITVVQVSDGEERREEKRREERGETRE
jgi:hypothetical protein